MEPSVIIGMPTYGRLDPDTMFSVIRVILKSGALLHNLDYRVLMYIDAARNGIVKRALSGNTKRIYEPADRKATHLMFMDADMIFPDDMIPRLLSHRKRIVSGLCFFKGSPHLPNVSNFVNDREVEMVKVLPDKGFGLYLADTCVTGCMLAELDVFREMQDYYGDDFWFRSEERGEDLWFFRRLKEMDIPAYVDLELECGHIGRQIVTREHYERYAKKELGHANGTGDCLHISPDSGAGQEARGG